MFNKHEDYLSYVFFINQYFPGVSLNWGLILIMASLFLKIEYFEFCHFFLILIFLIMRVYAHSVDSVILMFFYIQNLSIEWIKWNIIIFFHALTLILSKCQRQYKLTLAVGQHSYFLKDVIISITLFHFIVIIGLIHKCYEKWLLQIYFIGTNFFISNFFIRKPFIFFLF